VQDAGVSVGMHLLEIDGEGQSSQLFHFFFFHFCIFIIYFCTFCTFLCSQMVEQVFLCIYSQK